MIRKIVMKFGMEPQMVQKLQTVLQATQVEVKDTSGGCGQMYNIIVASPLFDGISRVKQHQLVTNTLSEELKGAHGFQIKTSVPPK